MNMSVTPIGSCRITNPLRNLTTSDDVELNMSGVYGYTHSSPEVIQLIDFLEHKYTPSKKLWNLIFNNSGERWCEEIQRHNKSDLYFVEISSAKVLEVDGEYLQLNYFNVHFSKFLSDKDRAKKFWGLCKLGFTQERLSFLQGDDEFNNCSDDDKYILSNVSVSNISYDQLVEDLKIIKDKLKNVVIVSHVDVIIPGGGRLKSRVQLIDDLKRACTELGITLFDPTYLMNLLGQDDAMEKADASYTHYSSEFQDVILEYFKQHFFKDKNFSIASDVPIDANENAHTSGNCLNIELLKLIHKKVNSGCSERIDNKKLIAYYLCVNDFHGVIRLIDNTCGVDNISSFDEELLIACYFSKNYSGVANFSKKLHAKNRLIGFPAFLAAVSINKIEPNKSARAYIDLALNSRLPSTTFDCINQILSCMDEECIDDYVAHELINETDSLGFCEEINDLLDSLNDVDSEEKVSKMILYFDRETIKKIIAYYVEKKGLLFFSEMLRNITSRFPKLLKFQNIIEDYLSTLSEKFANTRGDIKSEVEVIESMLILDVHNSLAVRQKHRLIGKLINIAQENILRKQYEQAIEAALLLYRLDEKNGEALYIISRAYYLVCDYKSALVWVLKLSECRNLQSNELLLLARCHSKNENYVDSYLTYVRLVGEVEGEQHKFNGELVKQIASLPGRMAREIRALFEANNSDVAVKCLMRIPELWELKVFASLLSRAKSYCRSIILDEDTSIQEKIYYAKELLRFDPVNISGLRALATNLSKIGDYSIALESWNKLIALDDLTVSYKTQREKCLTKISMSK